MRSFPLLCCSRSWAGLSLLSLLALALSPPAWAQGYPGGGGGYTVHCSGGTINGNSLTPSDSPYPGSTGSTTGTVGQSASPSGGQPGTCKITASDGGPVSAHISWNGGSANTPAPPAAIVMETSTVRWNGTVGDSPDFVFTPDPTAGLGSGVTLVNSQNGLDKISTGTKYSAATSGSGSTTTCSPSFSLSGTTGVNYDSYEYCSLTYTYTASASPVTIKLDGTTPDSSGNLNILVGQHCSASLVGIPAELLPNTTYSWTVSGATFQYWSSDTPANGNNPYNSDASYEVDGPGPLTNSTAGWYWNDLSQTPTPETVSCTATVTPPAGQGSSFTVTVTQKVTVYRPNWTATGTAGNMQVNTAEPGGNGTDYWLYAGPTPGSGETGGMDWYATVSSPNLALFGDGSVEMVQLVIPNVSYTKDGILGMPDYHAWTMNGQEGLDTSYPYPWTSVSPNYFGGDAPGVDLTSTNAVGANVSDQFEDYLMYFAPGSSQCVPLAHFVWSTDGTATIPNTNNWANYGAESAGPVTPSGTTKFGRSNSFPMWTQIITRNSGTF